MAAKKKPTPKKPKMTKTAFVLALPADMPAKEVVAKAKAEKIGLTEAHVYNIRSTAKKQGATGKKSKKASKTSKAGKAPKAKATTEKGDWGSKAQFVRAQPADMKANDVVAAAKKAGQSITASYVYEIRSADKKGGKVTKKAALTKTAVSTKTTAASSQGSEHEFRRLVVALGVERTFALLADVKKRLEQLIAGR